MAISFVDSGSGTNFNGQDVTVAIGTTPTTDDLLIIAYAIGDDDTVDQTMAMVTAGYTLVPGTDIFATSSGTDKDTNLGVFYKFWAEGDSGTPVADGLGGADAAVAAVSMTLRGVDTTTPFDVSSTTATGQDTYTPDPPSINWSTSGVWVVAVGATANTIASGVLTLPSGYTTDSRSRASADTTNVTIAIGYNSSPSDPEDPGTLTHNGSDSAAFSWAAVTMALRPSAPAAPKSLATPRKHRSRIIR